MTVRKVIYKITYPNKKFYIGKDSTDTVTYFGSVNSNLVSQDFTQAERDNFTVTKVVLWSSDACTDQELSQKEIELIRSHQSNNPAIGYNRNPPWRSGPKL